MSVLKGTWGVWGEPWGEVGEAEPGRKQGDQRGLR